MSFLQALSAQQLWGRSIGAYLTAVGILLGVVVATRLLRFLLVGQLRRIAEGTARPTDDLLVELLDRSAPTYGWLAAIWLAARQLALPPRASAWLTNIILVLVVFVSARAFLQIATHASREYFARRYGGDDARALALRPILGVAVWLIALVFILDNVGVKISTVLAGLGIGGIAVALAAQAVLSDLFSYVAIVFDRPFAIGDFIIVDSFMGTVERIGIKTTRVRSLGGELVIFGNTNLISNRIRNFKPLEKRRVQLGFGLAVQSPVAELAGVADTLKEIVTSMQDVSFERAHFKGFGASSLDFEAVYWVLSPDYNRSMDIQQAINIELMRRLEARDLHLAIPTRHVHVEGPGVQAATR